MMYMVTLSDGAGNKSDFQSSLFSGLQLRWGRFKGGTVVDLRQI
ncbi:hypothetical protein HanIR_Chr14g0724951 [Helianthus annuus]|nr:hypothetical protein HanIR_Chr14g0724951 [Helianthus annuus]